jgi:hypothetical protein
MSGIVCAVRGGPASQPTIAKAIALARETGLPLSFLYVVNLDFLSQTVTSRVHTISQEMHEMEGNVRRQLLAFAIETHADLFLIGWPMRGAGRPAFTPDEFEAFSREQEKLGQPRLVRVPPPEP